MIKIVSGTQEPLVWEYRLFAPLLDKGSATIVTCRFEGSYTDLIDELASRAYTASLEKDVATLFSIVWLLADEVRNPSGG